MFENISGVMIKGDMFEGEKTFNLFSKKGKNEYPTRISIIYGKNGSGKSTITKAFQKYTGKKIDSISSVSLYDYDNKYVTENDYIKENTFVFNEKFIEKNIKFKEYGLETIVMFGEQGDLNISIEKLEAERKEKLIEFDEQNKKLTDFSQVKNIQNPSYHWDNIRNILRGDSSWSGIDKDLKGSRTNSAVSDSIILEISTQKINRTKAEIELEFNNKLKNYNFLRNTGQKITGKVPYLNLDINLNKITKLLALKIERQQLSEREKFILDLVTQGNQKHFKTVQDYFANHRTDKCPFCLQGISDEYKKNLLRNIENVLNKDIENHITELQSVEIREISIDFSPFKNIEKDNLKIVAKDCEKTVIKLNDIIQKYNLLIYKKLDNAYLPIIQKELPFNELYELLNKQLVALEYARLEYNKKFEEVGVLQRELIQLNKQLAYFAVSPIYEQYLNQNKLMEEENDKLITIVEEGKEIKNKIKELQGKQQNISIAVKHINQGLKYVFFSSTRLSIKPHKGQYVLFSNSRPVKPHDISCGERNILALCYFFTLMMKNKNEKNLYIDEYLIVIDDPVSSFDIENKVGILSYLKSQLMKIMLSNKSSKVILLSHDLATVYDLIKQFEEIKDGVKNQNNEEKNKITTNFSSLELNSFEISDFSRKQRNEYTALLGIIYDFAADDNKDKEEENLAIGNIMRRVLEAFSTFEYKKGISTISCDQELLGTMGNESYSNYFENLMYRLVLNGQSHNEENVKVLDGLDFYSTISMEEKKRTARDVLCLINVLNPNHLKAHLSKKSNAIDNVDKWCENILNV